MDQDEDPKTQDCGLIMVDTTCSAAINSTAPMDAGLVNDLEHGLIPLMEYRHPELISPEVQVGFYLSHIQRLIGLQRNTFGLSVGTLSENGWVVLPLIYIGGLMVGSHHVRRACAH
jgi:hypothetical protein